MKKILLLVLYFTIVFQSFSQGIYITSLTTSPLNNGVNVNLKTTTGNGAGYLSHSYTVSGNIIDLSVCFWYNNTLPILNFNNDFFIPLPISTTDYVVNTTLFNSSSQTNCEYLPTGQSQSTIFLGTNNFDKKTNNQLTISPNPNDGNFTLDFATESFSNVEISLYDLLGKLVYKKIPNEKLVAVSLPNLPAGIYVVKVSNETFNETIKFVKQ